MTSHTRVGAFGLLFLCCVSHQRITVAAERFVLNKDEVVVFLGGTNMLRTQRAGYLETTLTRVFANTNPRFRDLSWEADTVFRQGTVVERWRKDGHFGQTAFGDLSEQLKRVKATTVLSQFGRIESMAGPSQLPQFVAAYERLIHTFRKHARQVVLVTPTPFEKPSNAAIPDLSPNNADLERYVAAIRKLATKHNVFFVDLFTNAKPNLTRNGMHLTDTAHATVAAEICRQLGVAHSVGNNEPLRQAVMEKHRLWYDYWRPANWKLLYGDDARRQFTRGGKEYVPFKEEWKKLIPLIDKAEQRVWSIANGKRDQGLTRPDPEILHGDGKANIEDELASFAASHGLKVNLFASEKEGLTSPLNLRWDPAGRMYVTVTTTYPHVFPGDLPNDKVILLEDTDRDGRADKSTVFAKGLNIPTGIEWGDGGIYVGQNTELLFLKDTDGDGQADTRRTVMSGFGNGDTHQTINSFIWSPGGELYFGQGDGCESRVETPWGTSSLFQAGFFRFRPRRLQLDALLDDFMGPGNPWGVAFDEWGQIFCCDGAGGITFLSPGQIPATYRRRLRTIGKPGGYCGMAYLDGRHLPDELRRSFAVNDFKRNRVNRFTIQPKGAGFELHWQEPLLQSKHRNFRPVDVKVGPDGAIYVVDWYNPVTCHQDDAYRDPNRDKAHGRIWRLTTKQTATSPPNLATASIEELIQSLTAPEHWTRYQAKRALTQRDPVQVAKKLNTWIRSLDSKLPRYEHHLYEALGAYATIEVVEPALLKRMLNAQDARARIYAARIVGRWHDRLSDPLTLLASRIADSHPQVRMEAVLACATIPSARSIQVAAAVVDQPMDEWIEYAFKQAIRHLEPHWLPAFERGELRFARPQHLAAVLNEIGGTKVIDSLKNLVTTNQLSGDSRAAAIAAILAVGEPEDLRKFAVETNLFTQSGEYDLKAHTNALSELIRTIRFRNVRPSGELPDAIEPMLNQDDARLRVRAIELTGILKIEELKESVLSLARNPMQSIDVRSAAFDAMSNLDKPASRLLLTKFSGSSHPLPVRTAAIRALVKVDHQTAANVAVPLLSDSRLAIGERTALLKAFVNHVKGANALSAALPMAPLDPELATQTLKALFKTGRSEPVLFTTLNGMRGSEAKTAKFDRQYVSRLATDAKKMGSVDRGALIFKSMACVSCHKIGGNGSAIGPDLSAIGTTLSADRIVEEVLWPNRQIKEGYSVIQVVTEEGRVHQGFHRKTKLDRESGDITLQDPVTKNVITIKKDNIENQRVLGSLMPTNLTSFLSRDQLVDLIRYLVELGRIR